MIGWDLPMNEKDDKMKKAYSASWKLMKAKMRADKRIEDVEALESIEESDVIIVRGSYDFIEQVFDSVGLPYTLISMSNLAQFKLDPKQSLLINCPGIIENDSEKIIENIKSFVRNGGFLLTTDWSLRNVLEPVFPGFARYNDRPTGDECVRVEILDKENPFVRGVMDNPELDDPVWWLEGSSYPIEIINKEKIKVLIFSDELKERYGEGNVAIYFTYGEGTVFHMISHYYLQRAETRTQRHTKGAETFAQEKGITNKEIIDEMKDLNVAEAESAYSSAQFFANIMAEQKKRSLAKEKKEKKSSEK
jgi:hypothetical protein